ncbi:hypothetical protein JAO71_06905 [Olleya sp. YSTF-M6]|uniref:Uncharacterized protein n=1 Tax=Olleya sediminilitoris TaxID=2795739 RepID=A0ABS1WKA0_9FLAO|nr:hypothetical protein [Olleya sediminilitoris]MBL7559533.1 hypothetical protein [Olleya sediminilitoris]
MSAFLTGDNLNNAIDDIIANANKFIHITSPYIKLDDHFKERFNLIKTIHLFTFKSCLVKMRIIFTEV